MMRILGPAGKRRRLALVTIVSAALVVALTVVAQAVLPGSPSKFESGNDPTLGLGNMTVDTTGNKDWISVATTATNTPYVHIADAAATNSDDSFTPGQKQDTTCPTVEGHKNPPKDDFTDVASYSEVASGGANDGDTYLYGATIRYAANGNASENIELKKGTSGLCPGSTTLLARTDGDKLLAIDYLGGGKAVQFHVLTWVTSGACNVANDVAPCWGATVNALDPTIAEGGVSTANFSAAQNPISGVPIVAGQFAEFGVNLSDSGIIGSGACSSFAQTVWESRSSGSSFVSSTKDITIEDKTITNCGEIKIIKRSSPRGVDQNFDFTSTIAGSSLSCTADATPAAFTLNDKDGATGDSSNNTEDCTNVPAGTYTVTEGANPASFAFNDFSCTSSGTGTSTTPTSSTTQKNVSVTLAAGGSVTCVYTNNQLTGAIKIQKNSTKTDADGNPLPVQNAGAVFSYDDGAGSSGSVTDNDATTGDEDSTIGTVCVSGLVAGSTYTVNETTAPDGYGGASQTDQTAVAVAGTDCGSNQPTGTGVVTFTNPPLSDIQVNFRDDGSGETSATISCDNSTGTSDTTAATDWDTTETVTGVEAPTTVICTIVIDP